MRYFTDKGKVYMQKYDKVKFITCKMGRMSIQTRNEVIRLHSKALTVVQIQKELARRDITVSRLSIYKLLRKWQSTQTVADLPRCTPSYGENVTLELLDFIDKEMHDNDELTAPTLMEKVNDKFEVNFSLSKIKLIRKKLGWRADTTGYCQLITKRNIPKRLKYAIERIAAKDEFDDAMFSDECTIQMESNGKLTFRRWWEPKKFKPKPKHPFKLHVWAAISRKGPSRIVIFNGIMRSQFFVDEILSAAKEFIDKKFPNSHRYIQDNDPKHTSKLTMKAYTDLGINWYRTPAQSPDMNPIENLWHELKTFLRTKIRPKTKDELVNGIGKFWNELDKARCGRYIDHLKKVFPAVVAREGLASGY